MKFSACFKNRPIMLATVGARLASPVTQMPETRSRQASPLRLCHIRLSIRFETHQIFESMIYVVLVFLIVKDRILISVEHRNSYDYD